MSRDYSQAIAASGLTIYDPIKAGDPGLWVPTPELEEFLNEKLVGIGGLDLPIKTRAC